MAETAFLTVRCPACGVASDRVPASLAGRTVRCPRCSARFAVPAAPTAPEPPVEAAPTVPDTDLPQPAVAEAGAVAPTLADDSALAPTRAEAPPAATPATTSGIAWEPEIPALPPAPTPTARIGGNRTRVTTAAAPAPATTRREDLRRAAPIGIPELPRAARAARRVPWGRALIALALLAAIGVTWLAWRRPAAGLRVSPHMAQAVPKEFDLIDLEPYRRTCSPGDYERHLAQMRSGNPDARDVACLAARGTSGVVVDVLDGAPIAAPEPLTALRLRRNAASALAGLQGDAVSSLCARLGDGREEARRVTAMALAVMTDGEATVCVRQALAGGSPAVQASAAVVLRQRAARGLLPAGEAWTLTQGLLASPDPAVRISGLLVAPVFTGDAVEPAVLPFLQDADPDVAQAAREAVDSIHNVHEIDEAHGDTGS